jgi:drug/metabolite transporter (DMT)-like permease
MNPDTPLSPLVWAELLLLGLIWGGVFLATRIALDEIGVFQAVAHRVFWAALVLWGYVLVRRLPLPRDPKIWGALLVMGLLNNALPFSLMAWGQLHIESGLTSIFNAATAIFTVLVAALVLADERLSGRKSAGIALGFFGVLVAIGPESLGRIDPRSLGQTAVVAATFCYALAAVWARRYLGGLKPQIAAMGMLSGSALVLVPLAWITEGPAPVLDLSLPSVLAIAYYATVATAVAYLLYYRILARAGAGNLGLVTLIIPPVAIALGALVRGETLAGNAYAGFGLIAFGLVVLDGRWRHVAARRKI